MFRGYYEPDSTIKMPGYIRVASNFLVAYPFEDELLQYIKITSDLDCIRKLHYIYAENDKLVGIYVLNERVGRREIDVTLNGKRYNTVQHIRDTMCYVFQDRLESYNAIINDTGKADWNRGFLSYDVWGNRVTDADWSQCADFDYGDDYYQFRRGYTQHEHLGSFGIINMNGRIYDPSTASFFSPDPYVVDATSTQAFNRYSYCLNNPLMYTDPSGEYIHILIGAAIGGTINWLSNGAEFS